jgi:hypothetical protein
MRCYVRLEVIEVPGIKFKYKLDILVHQEMLLKVTEIKISANDKRQSNPITDPDRPRGFRRLILSDFKQSTQEGGKVVSPTHRPPLPPGNIPGTHFCYRLSQFQGDRMAGRIMSMKSSIDTIGYRTCDLPSCSAVLQSTAPPRMDISAIKIKSIER